MATSAANRGKKAEGVVKKLLNGFEEKVLGFVGIRQPDAHAAGGRFTPQPGDFACFRKIGEVSRNWLLEVKEVGHSYRLPHGNFTPEAVARMQKRQLAGSECLMLIFHTKDGVWRAPPFDLFRTRQGGSWDLRDFPVVDPGVYLAGQMEIF